MLERHGTEREVLRPNDSNATLEKETLTKDEKRAAKDMFDKYDLDNSGEISSPLANQPSLPFLVYRRKKLDELLVMTK